MHLCVAGVTYMPACSDSLPLLQLLLPRVPRQQVSPRRSQRRQSFLQAEPAVCAVRRRHLLMPLGTGVAGETAAGVLQLAWSASYSVCSRCAFARNRSAVSQVLRCCCSAVHCLACPQHAGPRALPNLQMHRACCLVPGRTFCHAPYAAPSPIGWQLAMHIKPTSHSMLTSSACFFSANPRVYATCPCALPADLMHPVSLPIPTSEISLFLVRSPSIIPASFSAVGKCNSISLLRCCGHAPPENLFSCMFCDEGAFCDKGLRAANIFLRDSQQSSQLVAVKVARAWCSKRQPWTKFPAADWVVVRSSLGTAIGLSAYGQAGCGIFEWLWRRRSGTPAVKNNVLSTLDTLAHHADLALAEDCVRFCGPVSELSPLVLHHETRSPAAPLLHGNSCCLAIPNKFWAGRHALRAARLSKQSLARGRSRSRHKQSQVQTPSPQRPLPPAPDLLHVTCSLNTWPRGCTF